MTELLTAAQMRAIEAAAIASGEVTGLELMERAGRGVVEAVWQEWPELKAGSFGAVVLCGPGNNGGDGFVVARLLKEWGWAVEVFLYGDPEKLPPDARVNYARWRGMGEVRAWSVDELKNLPRVTLLVDAVFGTGLTRQLPLEVTDGFAAINRKTAKHSVAIDLPSGLDSDTGNWLGADVSSWLRAKLCVTFCMQKVGHHLALGPSLSKRLVTKPLGFRREEFIERGLFVEPEEDRRVVLLDQKLFGRPTPFLRGSLEKRHSFHKFFHGHALILSGPSGQGGAARLSARGALRIGAGLVTLGCPPDAIIENAAQLNVIMLKPIGDAAALTETLQDSRITALCLGPGMGVDRAAELLPTALNSTRPLVLDADALTALSRDPALFAQLHEDCILTPHAGEFARLFPDIAEKLNAPATTGPAYSKVDATRDAARRAGCTVLYKGPDTVIAEPSGRCAINSAQYERAAPWLATAGSGDVLAGFITGLLARGFAPMQAAETAAWLHVECARSFGPGLIAEDLPEELPKVFRAMGL